MFWSFFLFFKIFISIVFLSIASYQDLKTTEISDNLLYLFLFFSIFINILESLVKNDVNILINSLMNGTFVTIFSIIFYYSGQWGAGDSFLFSSIGFLNPFNEDISFSFFYFLLLSFVGFFYAFLNAFSIFFLQKKKIRFSMEEKKFLVLILFTVLFSFSLIKFSLVFLFIEFLSLLVFALVFFRKIERLMIKRVAIDHLKEGDVLLEFKKWVGITKREIEELKKRGKKFVYVKEGIRFAPAFLLSFLFYVFLKFANFDFLSLLLLFFP